MVLVHGGPGAPGYMAPVARELADSFRVLEQFQRGSGDLSLTVDLHVEDLHQFLLSHTPQRQPIIVGHSWGAMLALVFASVHDDLIGGLVLIGCGTFTRAARKRLVDIRAERTSNAWKAEAAGVSSCADGPDDKMRAMGALFEKIDSFDLMSHDDETMQCDARAHHESWDDMMRLQDDGVYPTVFASIKVPVLMLHGQHDPHPGRMIYDDLLPFIPHMEYRDWSDCGHYPWLERIVRSEFLGCLKEWLSACAEVD